MMLIDYIDRGADTAPDAPCLLDPDGSTAMTHAQFRVLTHRIAGALIRDGVRPGDRIGVLSSNHALTFALVIGILRAGAVWTAINVTSGSADQADFLGMVGCRRIICHRDFAGRAAELEQRIVIRDPALVFGPERDGGLAFTEWLASQDFRAPEPAFEPERVAMLLPTGGTTGRSKAVPITDRQIHLMCLAFQIHLREPAPPRYICATPMTHAAGLVCLPVLAQGGAVIVHNGVLPEQVLGSIERNRASAIFLPPTALYKLLATPGVREYDYSSLQQLLIAGAPLAPERLAEAVEVFGPVLTQTFGQAEAPLICTVHEASEVAAAAADPSLGHRLASCGRPSAIARVEIMDDDGNLLGPRHSGEIVVRSELVFDGYWQDPAATASTRRPGGWYGTGDVGVRDDEGFVYIVDRKKDMIITGGFNVFPSEVEAYLHTFPAVDDCAVIGLPDPKWGETVTAVIETKPGSHLDEQALIEACKAHLGPVKAPKNIIVRDLPRSGVGKVLKRELREEYWATSTRRI
ncbi:class I adenylate-forming enzyme family protein [Sciscionella marina]|uniref:class I adenylate-forming enzyme family protein n=1 Tax=Sciscionella marina TaxID=508770 RepID=UPI0004770654|nr:AMP-binding protein [Sciscionella marina]